MQETNVSSIYLALQKLLKTLKTANILLHGEKKLHIANAMYFSKSTINLLSFKNIHLNGYHIETRNEKDNEYFYIMRYTLDKISIVEKLYVFLYRVYYTSILVQLKHMSL